MRILGTEPSSVTLSQTKKLKIVENWCPKSAQKKLIGKSYRPQNKTFIRGSSPGVSDELWDKNAIGGR